MGESAKNESKVETGAQGAAESTESKEQTGSLKNDSDSPLEDTGIPQWAADLLESNSQVIASNNSLIDSLGQFKEGATSLVNAIVASSNDKVGFSSPEPVKKESIEVKPRGKYVVANGKKFKDSQTGGMYTEGMDVSKFSTERLASLLSQGIIQEKE